MTTFASDGTTIAESAPPPAETPAPPPAPAPPAGTPEVIDAPSDVAVHDHDPGPGDDAAAGTDVAVPNPTDVATADQWKHTSEWAYDWLEFKGDTLAIRVPKGAALQALGNSRHCSAEFQDQLVHMFVSKHISDETYERVTYRMVDPDDDEYTLKAWGELLNAIAELGSERAKAEAEALAAVSSGNDKKSRSR